MRGGDLGEEDEGKGSGRRRVSGEEERGKMGWGSGGGE